MHATVSFTLRLASAVSVVSGIRLDPAGIAPGRIPVVSGFSRTVIQESTRQVAGVHQRPVRPSQLDSHARTSHQGIGSDNPHGLSTVRAFDDFDWFAPRPAALVGDLARLCDQRLPKGRVDRHQLHTAYAVSTTHAAVPDGTNCTVNCCVPAVIVPIAAPSLTKSVIVT